MKTALGHALIALALQLAGFLALGDPFLGAALGVGIFLGREHAQAEYRWISRFGGGRRANMPLTGGFDIKVWDSDSVLDLVMPIILCALLSVLLV